MTPCEAVVVILTILCMAILSGSIIAFNWLRWKRAEDIREGGRNTRGTIPYTSGNMTPPKLERGIVEYENTTVEQNEELDDYLSSEPDLVQTKSLKREKKSKKDKKGKKNKYNS